jgi:hypothetical protein
MRSPWPHTSASVNRRPSWVTGIAVLLAALQICLISWIAWHQTPTVDEPAHLVAGLRIITGGQYDVYPVNPPAVKLIAASVVSLVSPKLPVFPRPAPGKRPEFRLGQEFLELNGQNAIQYIRIARLSCLAFALLGAAVCYAWSSSLAGYRAGLISLCLWCLCPNILAHAALITPDLASASFGLTCCYFYWRWLRDQTWWNASIAGIALGCVELTKFTWLILYLLFPILWLVAIWSQRLHKKDWLAGVLQLFAMFSVSFVVINCGYEWRGTCRALGQYEFVSKTLAGSLPNLVVSGNRFRTTPFEGVPIPLPAAYLEGIDLQWKDFQSPWTCYLDGEWKSGGWWYFYLLCFLYKVPVGAILLTICALLFAACGRLTMRSIDAILLGVPCAIFAAASSLTTMTTSFRYVLGSLPFLYVLVGIGLSKWKNRYVRWIGLLCLMATIVESLSVFPHSLAFFNYLSGGPQLGHAHLLESNLDWGQDGLNLQKWCDKQEDKAPLFITMTIGMPPAQLGIVSEPVPVDPTYSQQHVSAFGRRAVFRAGWYIIDVNNLFGQDNDYAYLRRVTPADRIGYTLYCYRLSAKDADILNGASGDDRDTIDGDE